MSIGDKIQKYSRHLSVTISRPCLLPKLVIFAQIPIPGSNKIEIEILQPRTNEMVDVPVMVGNIEHQGSGPKL